MRLLKIFINKLLGLINLKLVKKPDFVYHAGTESIFRFLKYLNYEAQHIVDVGAHMGSWSLSAMNHFEKAYFSLFEPQADLITDKRLVSNPKVKIYNLGVGKVSGNFIFKSSYRRDSFSFRESHISYNNSNDKTVKVVALDDFFLDEKLSIPYPDVIKIDAEGWDLDVINGAKELVGYCQLVFIEAGVNNFHFQNDFYRVVSSLRELNFRLIDITELNRPNKNTNHLQNVELAFVKNDSFLDKIVKRELKRLYD